jgi:hypothetical protein
MRREIRSRNTAFLLFTLAVCTVRCGRSGLESTYGQDGSAIAGASGTRDGSGTAGVGGLAGVITRTGVAGAAGGSSAGAAGMGAGKAGQGGAGVTGGAAGVSGGAAGGSAGSGGASGAAAGRGGNQADAGTEAGRDTGTTGCVSCRAGTTCAYPIADGCSAVGTCVTIPAGSPCNAVSLLAGCGCDGRDVSWHGACHPDLPNGYAPAPIVHTGYCP